MAKDGLLHGWLPYIRENKSDNNKHILLLKGICAVKQSIPTPPPPSLSGTKRELGDGVIRVDQDRLKPDLKIDVTNREEEEEEDGEWFKRDAVSQEVFERDMRI